MSATSWVYFIRESTSGNVKIGTGRNPEGRLRRLQVGHYGDLSIVAVMPGGEQEERLLHAQFSSDRLRGEWFRPDAVMAWVESQLADPLSGVIQSRPIETKLLQVSVPPALYDNLGIFAILRGLSKSEVIISWLNSLPMAASELDQVEAGQEMTGGRR